MSSESTNGKLETGKANFGTAPVFLTAIATILGAVMFLFFGDAVAHAGFIGTVGIILLGHLVTIPTALAIAEIATNLKVEGGGEYYMISRSFGLNIGAVVGIALYFSQAISVAFYIVAMVQGVEELIKFFDPAGTFMLPDSRILGLTLIGLLALLMLTKGADLGVKALYVVIVIIVASLVMFFAGDTGYLSSLSEFNFNDTLPEISPLGKDYNKSTFIMMFAICFPAFTGMTAGVGLSGDLKNPSKSIPLGTILATVVGMLVYIALAFKLAYSAPPEMLDTAHRLNAGMNRFVMSDIALWAPIIPIGLVAATFSSALGSIMVAPRTLQALGGDDALPNPRINSWLARGKGAKNEPFNATLVSVGIAVVFVSLGDVEFVAQIITMFFMVTYGSICLISFLEHFAADPSYRPVFRSRWYLSGLGAVMCIYLMFKINSLYALLALIVITILYFTVTYFNKDRKGMARIFQGVIFQVGRRLRLFVQKFEKDSKAENWRPSVVCISKDPHQNYNEFELLKWISHKYGFGTFIHLIEGYLSRQSAEEAKLSKQKLIKLAEASKSKVFLDTVISPSYTSAIAQILQVPGVSGQDNNMVLFDFNKMHPERLEEILGNFHLIKALDFDVCILGTSERGYGYNRAIHVWITAKDFANANLMILMAYIIKGHSEWDNAEIKIFSLFPASEIKDQQENLKLLVSTGRLPISESNINLIPLEDDTDFRSVVGNRSTEADLTIIGFRSEAVKHEGIELFKGYDGIGNVLFINTTQEKEIK